MPSTTLKATEPLGQEAASSPEPSIIAQAHQTNLGRTNTALDREDATSQFIPEETSSSVLDSLLDPSEPRSAACSTESPVDQIRELLCNGQYSQACQVVDQYGSANGFDPSSFAQIQTLRPQIEAAAELQELHLARGTSDDPRLQSMLDEQDRLAGEIEEARAYIEETQSRAVALELQHDDAGIVSWFTGKTEAIEAHLTAEQELLESHREQLRRMEEQQAQQRRLFQEIQQLEGAGKSLEADGDLEGAQTLYNRSQERVLAFASISGSEMVVVNPKYQEAMLAVKAQYEEAAETYDTSAMVLRTTKTVVIIAGATIATGGAAGVVIAAGGGLLAAGGAGLAAGTLAGSLLGAGSEVIEAETKIAVNGTSRDEAYITAANNSVGHVKDSALTAAGSLVGLGAGAKVAQALGGRAIGMIANGSVAGGSSAAFQSSAQIVESYNQAMTEFNAQHQHSDLTAAEREQLKIAFLAGRGLDASQIAGTFAQDVAIGTVGGGIGGATSLARGATSSRAGLLAAEAGEIAADIGFGVAVTAYNGEITTEQLAQAIGSTLAGNAVGRASVIVSKIQPTVPSTGAEASYQIKDYENLRKPLDPTDPLTQGVEERSVLWRINPENIKPTGEIAEQTVELRIIPEPHPRVSLDRTQIPSHVDGESIVFADPQTIRTSQSGVHGETADQLVLKMSDQGFVSAGDRSAIENVLNVVAMPDGGYTSVDNRRIIAAEQVGIPIVAQLRHHGETLSSADRKRFRQSAERIPSAELREQIFQDPRYSVDYKRNGQAIITPSTWGAAAELRVATNDQASFSINKPYGSIAERPHRRPKAQ